MSGKIETGQLLRGVAGIGVAGVVGAALDIAALTAMLHRKDAHHSLEMGAFLEKGIEAQLFVYTGGDRTIWPSIHRIHHLMSDSTLFPEYEIAPAIIFAEANPQMGVASPEYFYGLDRAARLSKEDVLEIGQYAREIVKERMGSSYQEPSEYTKEQLQDLLDPNKLRYPYPPFSKHEGAYTQSQIARYLLTDPHSPALFAPGTNGVREVLKKNHLMYMEYAGFFRDRPDLKPKDLQNNDPFRQAGKADIARGMAVMAAPFLIGSKLKPEDFAKAAVSGAASYGVRMFLEVLGGNAVNSLGHAGVLTPERVRQAIFDNEFELIPNSDGTYSTTLVDAGLIGQVLGKGTLDEATQQGVHHEHPEQILYSKKKGAGAVKEALWGSVLYYAANNDRIPFINRGKGFKLKMGEDRPDMANRGVQRIQRLRVENQQRKEALAA